MATYSIKDLERLSGIKAHTIRIWEKRYNLVTPKRTETNIRFYDDEDIRKILNIAFLNKHGYRISQIAQLDDNEIISKITDISEEDNDSDSLIDNLVISMIELDERKFDKILSTAILKSGFEKTVLDTIYPFFQKIGVLWQTGAINPAQEHFISNLVRQKLIVAIDGVLEENIPDSKRFILFLPEGELHEIGLLFYFYLLKKRGHSVIYLGQSVPFEDLATVIEIRPCDYLLTSFSSNISNLDAVAYLERLSTKYAEQHILFSTFDQENLFSSLPPNATRVLSALDFVNILDNLNINK